MTHHPDRGAAPGARRRPRNPAAVIATTTSSIGRWLRRRLATTGTSIAGASWSAFTSAWSDPAAAFGVALVLEDRRQPGEAAVEHHRLQAEVRRERPRAGEVAKAERLRVANHRPLPCGRRQPEHGRDDRRHREHGEGGAPAVVEEALERHRHCCRRGRSQRQRHREGAGEAAAVAGETDPDQRRHRRLGDRDGRAGDDRPGEQPRGAADSAEPRPECGERETRSPGAARSRCGGRVRERGVRAGRNRGAATWSAGPLRPRRARARRARPRAAAAGSRTPPAGSRRAGRPRRRTGSRGGRRAVYRNGRRSVPTTGTVSWIFDIGCDIQHGMVVRGEVARGSVVPERDVPPRIARPVGGRRLPPAAGVRGRGACALGVRRALRAGLAERPAGDERPRCRSSGR